MTLIIACKCKDGIVIGADSQATFGSSAGPVRKKTLDKIVPITEGILLAGAGDVPLIQKIRKKIEEIPQEIKESGKLEQIKEMVCTQIVHPLRNDMLTKFRDLYGEIRGEKEAPDAELIISGYSNGVPKIYLVSHDGLDEEEENYCAVGIGDAFAQVLLKDVNTCLLDIERVKPLVYKIILDAIETGAYGMGEPITIWTITNKGKVKNERIEDKEIDAIKDTVKGMREVIKEIMIGISNKQSNTIKTS